MSNDFVTISVDDKPFELSKAFFPSKKLTIHFAVDTNGASFTNKNGRVDIYKFLSALEATSKSPADQRYTKTKALIDSLPAANFEAIVDLLLCTRFEFPNADRPKGAQEIMWPEYILEKLPICLDAELLANHCRAYSWYFAASRRAVTIAHMSSTGLSKEFLRVVDVLTTENPALAFALCPTTLHDNTLVAPEIAHNFTCYPFGSARLNSKPFDSRHIKTDYKPVFLNDKSTEVKLGEVSPFQNNGVMEREIIAKRRIEGELQPIYDSKGFFPWLHPEKAHAGVLGAGGLECAVTLDEAMWQLISKTTDIDLFIYGNTEEDRKDMTRIVLEHLEKLGGNISHYVSVFKVEGLGREIQVVCPYARSPLGVLINFDSTFIQVGYQNGEFIATPGHCFFTPRSETLITRYNVRFHRMLKAIERGFMPVSDARGHLMYPTKTVFSSRWPFALTGSKPLDEEWIQKQARLAYAIDKKLKDDVDNLELMEIDDKELFDVLLLEYRERAVQSNRTQTVTMSVYDSLKLEDKPVAQCHLKTTKPTIEWIATTTEEAMKTFHPQGATLSNGFDIYTAGVNSTLPIPEDGDTEGIYIGHVLLRNVKVLPGDADKTYNLAAPEDKPLTVPHKEFDDIDKTYPERFAFKETVRYIEGIFLFGDVKNPKILEKEFKEHLSRKEANAKKRAAFLEKKRAARYERWQQESARRRELDNQRRAAKGLPSLEEQAELDRKALEARRKLQQAKREAAIARENAKNPKKAVKAQAVSTDKKSDQVAVGPNAKPAIKLPTVKVVTQPVAPVATASKALPPKKPVKSAAQLLLEVKHAKTVEDAKLKEEKLAKKDFALRTTIEFGDLHQFMEESAKLVTIGVHELPLLYKSFADGGKEYTTLDKKVIKRSDGMVKVRAPVSFSDCLIFDVDDLFVAQKTIDRYPERRYNAVVHLANLDRWIIKAHEHKDVITSESSRELIMVALQEELKSDKASANAPVAEFMRAIRHVANSEKFEDKANQLSCHLPHAHPGLPGEMPTLFISRLYVTRI